MFHLTTCPTCKTKFTLPEAAMGKRQVCPHCQSPFMAGKSEPEPAPVEMKAAVASTPLAKTMLGETEPTIKYNCPRCKKALEASVSEAGTKKPCPDCGQRLQVPAAPPGAAPAPGLQKTMLAESQAAPPIKYNCPNCKKPLESPASEAGLKKPCPACGQRLQIPMAQVLDDKKPNLNKTMLASEDGKTSPVAAGTPSPSAAQTTPSSASSAAPPTKSKNPFIIAGAAVGGVLFLGVFACLIVMLFTGPSKADLEKAKEYEAAKKELEEFKNKQALLAEKQKSEAELNKKWDDFMREMKREKEAHNRKLEDIENKRQLYQERYANDQRKKAEAELELNDLKRKLDQEKAANEARVQQAADSQRQTEMHLKAALDGLRAEISSAKANADRAERIIVTPPPPVYYPRFHPFHYFGGW